MKLQWLFRLLRGKVYCNKCVYFRELKDDCGHIANLEWEYSHVKKFKGYTNKAAVLNRDNDCFGFKLEFFG